MDVGQDRRIIQDEKGQENDKGQEDGEGQTMMHEDDDLKDSHNLGVHYEKFQWLENMGSGQLSSLVPSQ